MEWAWNRNWKKISRKSEAGIFLIIIIFTRAEAVRQHALHHVISMDQIVSAPSTSTMRTMIYLQQLVRKFNKNKQT